MSFPLCCQFGKKNKKMMDTLNNLADFFSVRKKNNIYNFYALAFAAGLGHVFFGVYWRYVDPLSFELPILRLIGIVICIILFVVAKNYDKLSSYKRWIEFWWVFSVLYNLPFFFTTSLLASNFHYVWLVSQAVMIFVVIMFFSGILVPLLVICLGIVAAIIFCKISEYEYFVIHSDLIMVLPVYLLVFVSAYIFSISNALGLSFYMVRESQFDVTKKSLKSMAASIAHEMRNPLSAINLTVSQVDEILNDESFYEDKQNRQYLLNMTSQISESIILANNVINIILSDLNNKKAEENEYDILNPSKIIPEIIDQYGYRSENERNRVMLGKSLQSLMNQDNNINLFRAVEIRVKFIIYNLLKNALYYLEEYPELMVSVGVESKRIGDKEFNVIFVQDTGPGIKKEHIAMLFDDFFTAKKVDGTGIGLSFCKRNMTMFGGDIICESKYGSGKPGWTKFSLLFPKIDIAETSNVVISRKKDFPDIDGKLLEGKRVIIADDDSVNLMMLAKYLERFSLKVDKVKNGQELLEKFKSYRYDIVISDINMPIMTGFEVAYKIREYEKENNLEKVPIIAITGDTEQDKLDVYIKSGMDGYFTKGDNLERLVGVLLESLLVGIS